MEETGVQRGIAAIWRIESARLIAGLTRIVRDLDLAEDLAQDALVAALEQWPVAGVPRNPGAWLMAAAKHRAFDRLRRNKLLNRKHQELEMPLVTKKCPSLISMRQWMTRSVTICSALFSPHATRCSPAKRALPQRFGCWAV